MRIKAMKLLVCVVLMLSAAQSAGADDWILVKTAPYDESAVVRDANENLVLIKVGDRLMNTWTVIGIGENKIILQKSDAEGKTLKVLTKEISKPLGEE